MGSKHCGEKKKLILNLMDLAKISPKWVENTVGGKGEIARFEQFLLFPQCFQKTCSADMKKPWLVWERANLCQPFETKKYFNHWHFI